jgi:hypothetical protein
LLAALLLAGGLAPQSAWLAATLGGVLDETYQWLVIYAHVPNTYFDYNDIVLNALGAAWAVVLAAAAFGGAPPEVGRRRSPLAVALLSAALAVAVWLAPPRVVAIDTFPYWRPALARALTGFDYHVMPASEGLAAVLLVWIVVRVATRAERGTAAAGVASVAALLFLVLPACRPVGSALPAAPVPVAAAARAGAAPAAALSANEPIITFWCGPPLSEFTDPRAAEIAAAGFNVVGAPCEGAVSPALNRRALEIAARHGLRLWIADRRVGQPHDGVLPADWEARLAAAVADYRDQPALGGYFLIDEPSTEEFARLAKVVARLRAVDPSRLAYVNLLPDFTPPDALGSTSYRAHVEEFVRTVRPALLSYDYYPFKTDTDREGFFDNLVVVREVALASRIPFLVIVQAMPHGPYRDPTAAELAWQVHHAVASGARGISYFAYWTPVQVENAAHANFRRGLVEHGEPTEHLAQVAQINREVRAYYQALDGFTSTAVADSRGRFGTALPIAPIEHLAGAPVTAGFFARNDAVAVMLVNQDYRNPHRILLVMLPGAPLPEAFDPAAGRWHQLTAPTVALPAGGATLLRWT